MSKNREIILQQLRTAKPGTVLRYDKSLDRFIRYHARVLREIRTQRDLLNPSQRILVLGERP
jgi:hypothetical protein